MQTKALREQSNEIMSKNSLNTEIITRNKELNIVREKLKNFIFKNSKYNYRDLSRLLKKNDAYIQQYLFRGTPNILTEEVRNKLSNILEIEKDDITPEWLKPKLNLADNNHKVILLNSIKPFNKKNELIISKSLIEDLKFSNEKNLFFYQFNNNHDQLLTFIINVEIKTYEGDHTYILKDKDHFFLAKITSIPNVKKKLVVKPFLSSFNPFHIKENQLNIFGKIIWQSQNYD